MKERYKINSLEQVRLLSDPFKLSILQAFAEEERTTKEVAETLKQPITKLCRHVMRCMMRGSWKSRRKSRNAVPSNVIFEPSANDSKPITHCLPMNLTMSPIPCVICFGPAKTRL